MANFISEILDRVSGRKRQKPGKAEKQTWLIPPASGAKQTGPRHTASQAAAPSRENSQRTETRTGQTSRPDAQPADLGLIPPKPTRLSTAHESARRAVAQPTMEAEFPAVELVPPTRKTPPQQPMSRDEHHRLKLRETSGRSSGIGANGLIPPPRQSVSDETGNANSAPAPMLRLRQRDRV